MKKWILLICVTAIPLVTLNSKRTANHASPVPQGESTGEMQFPKVREGGVVTIRTSTKLHPLVQFDHPEKIRSFADPKLAQAYNVYFSAIGKGREEFPFSGSPFDTEENSQLAAEILSSESYLFPLSDKKLMAIELALAHLVHSGLQSSSQRIEALAQKNIQLIERDSSGELRSIRELDLRNLLSAPTFSETRLLSFYQQSQDPLVKQCVAMALTGRLEKMGKTGQEIQVYLESMGIGAPQVGPKLEENT